MDRFALGFYLWNALFAVFAIFLALVVIGLLFLFVRFLLVGTKAALLYIAINGRAGASIPTQSVPAQGQPTQSQPAQSAGQPAAPPPSPEPAPEEGTGTTAVLPDVTAPTEPLKPKRPPRNPSA